MKDEDFAKLVKPLCKETPRVPKRQASLSQEVLEKSIEDIVQQTENNFKALAARYREEVLLPFCKKHKVTFAAGNGTFCFYKDGKGVYLDGAYDDQDFKPGSKIIKALTISTSYAYEFSQYFEDITKEDIQ